MCPTLSRPQDDPNQPQRSIGQAEMKPDGTLVLVLRAEGPGGITGDARFEYPVGHPRYDAILSHLGGLLPMETKGVPPWPENL